MADTEVIDLCSSDEEGSSSDQEDDAQADAEQVSSPSLDHGVESSPNNCTVSNSASVATVNNNEDSTVSRKRPAAIDLTGDDSTDNEDDVPQQKKKCRGGGQGSSLNITTDLQDESTSAASLSSPSAASASPPSSLQIVLENDGRVKDTGILHEGLMDLLYQLNQTTIPIPAKLCTRNSVSVSNPYAKQSLPARLPSLVHWIQQQENWSCGYRSLQMVLTALLPSLPADHAYYQHNPRRSDHVAIPSLGQIQSTLEQAWREGYDPQGAKHYRGRILGKMGKPGELGAIEISTVMTYWGLDATVVQFVTCSTSRKLLPLFVKSYFAKALGKEDCPYCGGHGSNNGSGNSHTPMACLPVNTDATLDSSAMANKILQFAEASLSIEETCDCPVLPLYLQWEGHAVTIVGYHEQNGSLLVFDPRKKLPQATGTKPKQQLWNTFQLDPEYLRNRDTQIIIASYKSQSAAEKERRRDDMGVVTAAEEDVLRAIAASRSR